MAESDAEFFPPAGFMKNKRSDDQKPDPIGFKADFLKAAGRMILLIAGSTSALFSEAIFSRNAA